MCKLMFEITVNKEPVLSIHQIRVSEHKSKQIK